MTENTINVDVTYSVILSTVLRLLEGSKVKLGEGQRSITTIGPLPWYHQPIVENKGFKLQNMSQ